jgi:phosphopantetheine--protein transferase-like protein
MARAAALAPPSGTSLAKAGGGFLSRVLAGQAALYPETLALSAGEKGSPAASAGPLLPHVHLRSQDPCDSGSRVLDTAATCEYYRALLDLTTDVGATVALPLEAPAQAAFCAGASTSAATSGSAAVPADLAALRSAGVSFAGKTALITGCGPASIGLELVKALLTGGATVVATTSRFSAASTAAFRRLYQEFGATGSRLIVLPFNQGSAADCASLISHVTGPLGLSIDFLIPFGAIPEAGIEVLGALGGGSELAHRIMLTNVLRMIGAVAADKRARGQDTRPALTLLPLSPNHGVFGGDGLYAESKLGLEALPHKWHSEGWGPYVSIAGAVIGWTRGTGLMAGNNIVSQGVEEVGCRTFSQAEMALNLLALLHPRMVRVAAAGPVWADLRGGFHAVPDLKAVTASIRAGIEARAAAVRAVAADAALDAALSLPASAGAALRAVTRSRRGEGPAALTSSTSAANPGPDAVEPVTPTVAVAAAGAAAAPAESASAAASGAPAPSLPKHTHVRLFEFPELPAPARLRRLSHGGLLQGMVDLDQTVVCVGYGEVGPWGSARTRWDMERGGEFSLEGCVLLAWLTGRIRYHSGPHPNPPAPLTGDASAAPTAGAAGPGVWYGWVDAQTGEALRDDEIKGRYEADMLAHAGIRVVEPALFAGYEPARKLFMHSVALDRDMGWVEVGSRAEADEYVAWLGRDRVDVRCDHEHGHAGAASGGAGSASDGSSAGGAGHGGEGVWRIRLRKGATLSIPRAMRFDRWVAGQLPTGWDATRLGVPADLAARMDPVVLYSLVATAEALSAAGVTDAYEFYRYVHVSAVGNSVGGGMGGMSSLRKIFRERFTETDGVPSDVLQESFINTTPAWLNMLLFSSSGPIKTPVGACATAAESVDIAVETIQAGKAAVMVCGGVDDFCEEGSYEFAQMGATSNSAVEAAAGREPREAVRPFATTRGGFMESQGAGMAVLTTARLALAMGLPLRGVIALSSTATDKAGRSVPAPGQGLLTTARESVAAGGSSPGGGSTVHASAVSAASLPLLDLGYRKRRLTAELRSMEEWRAEEEAAAAAEAAAADGRSTGTAAVTAGLDAAHTSLPSPWLIARLQGIAGEAARLEASARARWCSEACYRGDGRIAPLRGALALFGLSVDDITVASFHGTGTTANDANESELVHAQMAHLGRTPGQPVLAVAQKALTGHPKGAAAAWMLNGAMDMLCSGDVPGNPNGDDIDPALRRFTHIAYLSQPLRLGAGGVKSVLLKSFGFGQAGGEVLVVHPDYLLASLDAATREAYSTRRSARERAAQRAGQEVLAGRAPLVRVKTAPPYSPELAQRVYLNPAARAHWDADAGEHRFGAADVATAAAVDGVYAGRTSAVSVAAPPLGGAAGTSCGAGGGGVAGGRAGQARIAEALAHAAAELGAAVPASSAASSYAAALDGTDTVGSKLVYPAGSLTDGAGGGAPFVGVDVEPVATFEGADAAFLARNFSPAERSYCAGASDPAASLAGRWAAKEAVVKALTAAAQARGAPVVSVGSGAPLRDIEISASALPVVGTAATLEPAVTAARGALITSGAPTVTLSGRAAALGAAAGVPVGCVRVSISHGGDYAVAMAAVTAGAAASLW